MFINEHVYNELTVYHAKYDRTLNIDIDEYITGVVAAEMPATFEIEALKAQAVAARTYLIKKEACSLHPGSDICTDPSHCQAYKDTEELKSSWGNSYNKYIKKISKAVADTSGEIIVYDSEPISAVFHSTSSGRTENSEDVWSNPLPYLKSTDSPMDIQSPKYSSQKTIPLQEFENTLISANNNVSFETGKIGEITRTAGGSIDTIILGGCRFDGVDIRKIFDLNSSNFDISYNENEVTFTVYGYGHGVGMSQYGANYMAKEGSSYKEILKNTIQT